MNAALDLVQTVNAQMAAPLAAELGRLAIVGLAAVGGALVALAAAVVTSAGWRAATAPRDDPGR